MRVGIARDPEIVDVLNVIAHRPELFGRPFSEALQEVMRGPSDWSVSRCGRRWACSSG